MDANKRTALNVALTFLAMNGHTLREDANDALVEMMVDIAEGKLTKEQVAHLLHSFHSS